MKRKRAMKKLSKPVNEKSRFEMIGNAICGAMLLVVLVGVLRGKDTVINVDVGDSVTVRGPASAPASQPVVDPAPEPSPQPEPPAPTPVTSLPSVLLSGQTYDLGGGTVKLKRALTVQPGKPVTLTNGAIEFSGDGGKVGSGGMAAVNVGNGASCVIETVTFKIGTKNTVAYLTTGGTIELSYVKQNNGGLLWCQGGRYAEMNYCESLGMPDKYYFCNFSAQLDKVRWKTTHDRPIRQGNWKNDKGERVGEACVRLMQIKDFRCEGLFVIGSNYKFAIQDRPGGEVGKYYDLHEWVSVKTTGGGVALGNYNDPKDKNWPFGRLRVSRWENCDLDKFVRELGSNPAMGIDKIEVK